jgi:DNA helicase-2/ATP-dependent DNA helicase PcrA
MNELISVLNERQKEAVLHTEGPLLVIAGAGAGKTKVITHRAAYIIKQGIRPDQILAVTFTNKAAAEMKQRIQKLLAEDETSPKNQGWPAVGTFHSICARILRENAKKAGRTHNFSILDSEDSLKIIKNALKNLNINQKQFQPSKMLSLISRQKSELIKFADFKNEAGEEFFPKTLALIWEEYEKQTEKQDGMDFDDLISKTVFLFEEHPDILEKYQDKWRYIMVDEFQDTNGSQYKLVKLLAQKYKNICAVGDEDQSIYSWRGANFENVFRFEKDWQEVKTVMLEENYRSVKRILSAANSVIANNKMRKPKNLFSRLDEGENIKIYPAEDEGEEAEFVAEKTRRLIEGGTNANDIAVLYRANFQSRALEEMFIAYNLPYRVIGTKFFDRKEIKDAIAYIKAGLNHNDFLSIERIITEPPKGFGKTGFLAYLAGKAPREKTEKIDQFFGLLREIKEFADKENVSKTLIFALRKSGYETYLKAQKNDEALARLQNLQELVNLGKRYDTLNPPDGIFSFLQDIALLSDQDTVDASMPGTDAQEGQNRQKNKKEQQKDAVRLMTVHAAKGLEFKNVFITGLEEGLFPLPISGFFGRVDDEEERRLFYVALTRAKEKIFLSFAVSRMFFGGKQISRPSRFLDELPQELLETEDGSKPLNFIDYDK